MRLSLLSFSCVAVAACFLSSGVGAVETPMPEAPNMWVSAPFNSVVKLKNSGPSVWNTQTKAGITNKDKAGVLRGEILYTGSETEPGLYFRCSAGQLQAGLVFEPQNMAEGLKYNPIKGHMRQGKFIPDSKSLAYVDARFNDGQRKGLGQWYYFRDKSAVLSPDRMSAAQLYNAVVRGDAIRVKASREKEIELSIPKIDATFADFGADCGIGRQAG